jgi:hypothetical protein
VELPASPEEQELFRAAAQATGMALAHWLLLAAHHLAKAAAQPAGDKPALPR